MTDSEPWRGRTLRVSGWTQTLVIGVVVAVVMALGGGFETGAIPLLPRIAYWIGLLVSGVVVAQIVRGLVGGHPALWRNTWLAAAVICAVTTIPMTLVVAVSSALMQGVRLRPERLFFVFPDVVAISLGTTVLSVLAHEGSERTAAAAPGAPPAKFLARLPPALVGAELYAVEAQDHYLRLHTSRGQDLILMRLSDAVAELEGIEGARTHRSWWVARGAVTATEKAEGRATLTLANGARAPVSRSYLKSLREAGWL